jgi:hypothetical protein
MQHTQKRRRNEDQMKHTFVFRQCAEVPHTSPASVDIQFIETLKNQIERLKADTETMSRRLEHLERRDEISSARLRILESKSKISYRFRSSTRQKDDVYVCRAADCGFRFQKSTKLHSHWKESSSPEHQLMASLWNSKYCYPCSKWFDNTKAKHSHEAIHSISASPRSVDLDLRKILDNCGEVDVDGPVQECRSVSSGNSLPVTTPVGHSLSRHRDLQYTEELGGGDRRTPAHAQKPTIPQLSAPEQRDSNFHSQAAQPPLSASADANDDECLPVRPTWQSGDDWPSQASSCLTSGNANVQGEEYLPQPTWQSGDDWPGNANIQGEEYFPIHSIWQSGDDWPTQDTQVSSCPAPGNANVQGEEFLPIQPIWQSGDDWPTQGTQAYSCPASGNANTQGKGVYSIQATLQSIGDWPTQASPYPASKDANHQGQNSHAPFQEKDLTPQLVQLRQRPANFRALTSDELASRAKPATNTSHGAPMQCVGCNQYQALISIITRFLNRQEVQCHDRVSCRDGGGSFVSVVAGTAEQYEPESVST